MNEGLGSSWRGRALSLTIAVTYNHQARNDHTGASASAPSSVVKAFGHIFADVMSADRLNRDRRKVTAFVASYYGPPPAYYSPHGY
jgi:hypothetical protein